MIEEVPNLKNNLFGLNNHDPALVWICATGDPTMVAPVSVYL